MVAQPARKLEDDSDKFNEDQLRALGIVSQEYIDDLEKGVDVKPEKDSLDVAVSLGLITEEIRKSIGDQLRIVTSDDPNGGDGHKYLVKRAYWNAKYGAFHKNVDKGKPKMSTSSAFKRAFESVYGRFLLESGKATYNLSVVKTDGTTEDKEVDLEDEKGVLMKRLGEVLKFPLESKLGLKGRSELIAATRRLRMVGLEMSQNNGAEDTGKELATKKQEEQSLQAQVNFVHGKAEKLADLDAISGEIDAIDPVGLDASNLGAKFNQLDVMVQSLDGLAEDKIPDAFKSVQLAKKFKDCEKGVAAVQRQIDSGVVPFGGIKMALSGLILSMKNLRKELQAVEADMVKQLAAKKAEIVKVEAENRGLTSSTNDSLCSKILAKIDKEIEEVDASLTKAAAKPDGEEKDKEIEELKSRKATLVEQQKDPVLWIIDKAFPKISGAEINRLERLHHDAEHHENDLKEVHGYFTDRTNVKKILKSSQEMAEMTETWEAEKAARNDDLEKKIAAATDPKEKARLQKSLSKADLPLSARITYLEEQIESRGSAILSADQMSRRLSEGRKRHDFNEDQAKAKMEADNEKIADERGELKEELRKLKLLFVKTKEYRTELAKLFEMLAKAEHAGIELNVPQKTTEKEPNPQLEFDFMEEHRPDTHDQHAPNDGHHVAAGLVTELQAISQENFNPRAILALYGKLNGIFESSSHVEALLVKFDQAKADKSKATKTAKKALDKANADVEKSKDLTDPQAALKIVGVLVAEQFPRLSMVEQEKLARLVLAQDVAKLQTEEGYDALAKRGSSESLDLSMAENLRELAVRGKLIGFKYQEGDKEVQPFKGMKPENFKDWASIEKLFNLGQLNHKNGFFLMAALEIFDEKKSQDSEVGVVRSVQSLRVEDKLKFLLAKQLGVHERMHVAGVNKIINDAFKEQMEKVRPLVKAHFDTYDNEWEKGGKGVKAHRIQLLKLKYDDLNDKLRKGEIDHAVYEIKLKALVKEATDADVIEEVGFSQNSMLSGFWHSKHSQWIRDRGYDVGEYVGQKALRFGWGSVKGGALGSLNAAGWLGLRGTSLGVGLAKWPTAILTGIGSGIFSIFRRGKWMDNVKGDVGKVMSTAGGWQDSMKGKAKGLKILSPIGKQIAGEWGKSKYEGSKYADRNKEKEDRRAEKLKVLEEKAQLKAVEIASSPFIDLAQYKARIEELDKILGTATKFPAEGNVRVGHEEKPVVEADKKPPAAAAGH